MAETSDFAGARAALSTSMAVIGPMLQAMQDASKVFDAMANAQAHVDVLTAGVVKAQAEQKKIATSIEKATAKIEAAENTAQAAETASLKRVAEAQADADTRVQAAKEAALASVAAIDQRVAATHAQAEQEIADIAARTVEAAKAFAVAEAERTEAIAVLEKKLNSLRNSAAKFAAALTGE